MNIAIVSLNDRNYQPLADLTWEQNKVKYADKHEYAYACKTDGFYNVVIGFEKIWFMRDMFDAYPDLDWMWWTGTDTLITNMNTKLEDRIDNNYHFIIATDCNGINADSFFVRNTPEGRGYLDLIKSKYEEYKNHVWAEQQVIIDTAEANKDIIKFVPQKDINAYDYGLYPECVPKDKFGNDGQWSQGDLLIHWPGTSLWKRLELAKHYMGLIVE